MSDYPKWLEYKENQIQQVEELHDLLSDEEKNNLIGVSLLQDEEKPIRNTFIFKGGRKRTFDLIDLKWKEVETT